MRKRKTHARSRRFKGPLCLYTDDVPDGYIVVDDQEDVTCTQCKRALKMIPAKKDHPWYVLNLKL